VIQVKASIFKEQCLALLDNLGAEGTLSRSMASLWPA